MDIKALISKIPAIIPAEFTGSFGEAGEQIQRITEQAKGIDLEQIKADAQNAIDMYKKAETAKIVMQAISTAAIVGLCYFAWKQSKK